MAPFFDQPGSQAGPYSTPPQQGIFSKIMSGVNVALKLGDFYQDWQTKSQAQKTGAMQQFASKVGIIQALNQEGAAASPDMVTQAGELGIPLPSMTDKMKTGMGERVMSGISPTVGEMVPGGSGFALPDGSKIADTGGMGTRLDSPELAQKQATFTQGMAAIPAVGVPMIPGKKLTKAQMEVDALESMAPSARNRALFKGTDETMIFDPVKGVMVPTGTTGRVVVSRPPGLSNDEWDRRQGVRQEDRLDL